MSLKIFAFICILIGVGLLVLGLVLSADPGMVIPKHSLQHAHHSKFGPLVLVIVGALTATVAINEARKLYAGPATK